MKKSLLVLIAFIFWVHGSSRAQTITVFRDANWSGPSLVISADWDAAGNPDWNDQISSIRVPDGTMIKVFADSQFGGTAKFLKGDWTIANGDDPFNDAISSIRFLHDGDQITTDPSAGPSNKLCCQQELPVGGALGALNGRYILSFQQDRNLVVYKLVPTSRALWATATNNRVNRCVMQADGNLVLYNDGTAIWSSHTYGNPNAFLTMQDDGNLVIYSTDGRALWASNTAQADDQAGNIPPSPPAVTDGPCAMEQSSYDAAVHAVDGQAFKDTKLQMAKQAIRNKCLSLDQIRGIAKLFSFEDQTLDFVKYAYDFTNSKGDYYTLSDVFSFDANVQNFTAFLGTK